MYVLVKCVLSYFQSDSNLWFFTLKYLKRIKKSAWATQWSYLGKFHMNVICRYSPRTFCCSTCASTLLTGNSGGSYPSGFNIKKRNVSCCLLVFLSRLSHLHDFHSDVKNDVFIGPKSYNYII